MHNLPERSHLRLVDRHETEPRSSETLPNPLEKLRRKMRTLLYIVGVAGAITIGGEIAGLNCISTPYQAVSVLRAKNRLSAVKEKLMAYAMYVRALDADEFVDNPWGVRRKALEVSQILDEAIEIVEDLKKSGARFRPAVLMDAFGPINEALYYLESDTANELYRKAAKWRRKKSKGFFVDKQGIAAAGYAVRDIRDKVRILKKLLRELQDSTLDDPTNNSLLNIVMGVDEKIIENRFSSSVERFQEQTADLEKGDTSEYIGDIQRQLIKLHLLPDGDDDGICGRRTLNAARTARETIELINELEFGAEGDRVKRLQRNLIRAKCLPRGEADGSYGEKTAAGVLKFKRLFIN